MIMHWTRLVRAVVALHRRIQYDMSEYKVTMLRVGRTSDSACLSADLPEGSHQGKGNCAKAKRRL
jgi:hypothetical protein